jgi:hypothetical protein
MDKPKPKWKVNELIRRKERYKTDPAYRQRQIEAAKKSYRTNPPSKENKKKNAAVFHKRMVAKDSLYVRKQQLKRKYNMSLAEYELLYEIQNGRCNICFLSPEELKSKYLVVDHDHKTGRVRGLLCNNCNAALGFVKENTKVLESMILYANKHNGGLTTG